MKSSDFDYPLPPSLIAQSPMEPRDHARLMVISRQEGSIQHRRFFEICDFLRAGDILVCNDSRVLPARLMGRKPTGGMVEILLLRRLEVGLWEGLLRPGRRVPIGSTLYLGDAATDATAPHLICQVLNRREGIWQLHFPNEAVLESLGQVPLPHYIKAPLENSERYQTVYARARGSVAAPTAGLHFTLGLMERLRQQGVEFAFCTLHLGLDSFRPIREPDPREHPIQSEYLEMSEKVAQRLSQARAEGRRIIAVGTSSVRALETCVQGDGSFQPFQGWTNLFILPGHAFLGSDALITNFHLPHSTHLMLVSAFAGNDLMRRAYGEAIAECYRFYSFGDAQMIL